MSLDGAITLEKSKQTLKWISNEDCNHTGTAEYDKHPFKGIALSP
jgi:hypothetical protein